MNLHWPDLIAAAAVACYVSGLLFRDQIILRLLILGGSCCYIVYYSVAVAEPLWAAMAGSTLIVLANLYGLGALLASRRPSIVPERQRGLREAMGGMEPGLFTRLMRLGDELRAGGPVEMTRQGERPDALWFLVSGRARLDKNGQSDVLEGPCFVGEIGWLTSSAATADVTALPGASMVRWDRVVLLRTTRRSVRLENALNAAIAADMARKVAIGRPAARTPPAADRTDAPEPASIGPGPAPVAGAPPV